MYEHITRAWMAHMRFAFSEYVIFHEVMPPYVLKYLEQKSSQTCLEAGTALFFMRLQSVQFILICVLAHRSVCTMGKRNPITPLRFTHQNDQQFPSPEKCALHGLTLHSTTIQAYRTTCVQMLVTSNAMRKHAA